MRANYWAMWLWFLLACLCVVLTTMALASHEVSISIALLVAGLVLLALALRSLPNQERRESTFGMCGCLVILFFVAIFVVPIFLNMGDKRASTQTACLAHIKQLGLAAVVYADDADGHFPVAANWRSATSEYSKEDGILRCPKAKSPWTYGMNSALSGKKVDKIDNVADLVLLFETDSQVREALGGPESFVRRHNERGSIGFADGHAKLVSGTPPPDLRWKP